MGPTPPSPRTLGLSCGQQTGHEGVGGRLLEGSGSVWPQLAEHCLSKGLPTSPPRWVEGLSWETRCPESSEGAVGA